MFHFAGLLASGQQAPERSCERPIVSAFFVLKLPVAALRCTGAHTALPRMFVHGVVTVEWKRYLVAHGDAREEK